MSPKPRAALSGRTLEEANVVRSIRTVGDWQGNPLRISEQLPEGQDVAVILEARAAISSAHRGYRAVERNKSHAGATNAGARFSGDGAVSTKAGLDLARWRGKKVTAPLCGLPFWRKRRDCVWDADQAQS